MGAIAQRQEELTLELFDPEFGKQDSPRLAWLKKHNLNTYKSPGIDEEDEPWSCWTGQLEDAIKHNSYVTGETEDEAITNWAIENGVKLWNEE